MMTDVEPGLVDAVSADVLADQQAAFEVAFVAFGQDVVFSEAGLINLLRFVEVVADVEDFEYGKVLPGQQGGVLKCDGVDAAEGREHLQEDVAAGVPVGLFLAGVAVDFRQDFYYCPVGCLDGADIVAGLYPALAAADGLFEDFVDVGEGAAVRMAECP